MGALTRISWADGTLNFWIGCTKVSPLCDFCYAEAREDHRLHRVVWGPHGERLRTKAGTWNNAIRWSRRPELLGSTAPGFRPFVFVNSLSDFFDNQVPTEWREDAWQVMRENPRLIFLLLTKRPQNIAKMLPADGSGIPPNVALGTSVGVRDEAIRNCRALLSVPGALFYFLSCEPLLEDIADLVVPFMGLQGSQVISWVLVGGESGAHARPMSGLWVERLRLACEVAGAVFHFKQWGEWLSFPATYPGIKVDSVSGGLTVSTDGKVYREADVVVLADARDIPSRSVAARIGKERAGHLFKGKEYLGRPAVEPWKEAA